MKVRLTIRSKRTSRKAIWYETELRGKVPKVGQAFPIDGLGDPLRVVEVVDGDGDFYAKEILFQEEEALMNMLAESHGWSRQG
jgi:hypothetical protein